MALSGLTLNPAKVKYLPPTGVTLREDFFEDIYATYESDDTAICRLAQVIPGLKVLGGPYGAAPHVGAILAERTATHERLIGLVADIEYIG